MFPKERAGFCEISLSLPKTIIMDIQKNLYRLKIINKLPYMKLILFYWGNTLCFSIGGLFWMNDHFSQEIMYAFYFLLVKAFIVLC